MKPLELGQIIDGKTRDYYNGIERENAELRNLVDGVMDVVESIPASKKLNPYMVTWKKEWLKKARESTKAEGSEV